jgi:AcrR family transcriptional regulator
MITDQQQIQKISKLFRKYGIKSVTMDDIARELCISKKTLYHQVDDKNALVSQIMQYDFAGFEGKFQSVYNVSVDVVDEFIRINTLLMGFFSIYSSTVTYDLKKYFSKVYDELKAEYMGLFTVALKKNLDQGRKEGLYRSDLLEDVVLKLMVSRIEQLPESEVYSIDDHLHPDNFKTYVTHSLRGMVSLEGERLLEKYLLHFEDYLYTEKA